jgi:hypothetical protein
MTGPPPLMKPASQTKETRFFDSYPVAARGGERPNPARCSVSFWNLTDRALKLHVAGRDHVVPARQRLMLELERRFVWEADGRPPQTQQVEAAHPGVAIVLRR